jgi:hypothetical protein
VILAATILVTTILAALAAMENFTGAIWGIGREPDAFLGEYIVRDPSWDIVEKMIISHLHLILALLATLVMMIFYRISNIPRKPYILILIATIPGIFLLSFGAWTLHHQYSWIGSGILLLCALIMAIFGWRKSSINNLEERYQSASRFEKIKGIFKDPVNFSKYFLFLFVNATVSIPGIYVGINLDLYRSLEYEQLELSFIIGHWHILGTILATILMLLAIDYFNIQGRQRKIVGWILLIGSIVGFTGTTSYILRPPPTDLHWLLFVITIIGMWLLFIGFAMGAFLLAKKYLQHRREIK